MKNKIIALLLMCVLVVATFTGCNNIKLSNNPAKNDLVTSNGGMVVQKGDYIYFTNGYLESSSLSNGDNKYGDVEYTAIYRAKTENGELMYDVTEDEKGNEVKTLKNVDLVVPKVVGADTCQFFIFDDYIYYVSPTTEKDKTGKSRFDYITLFSVKIDGTENKKLYSVDTYSTSGKFNMVCVNDTIYAEIYDGSKIVILTIKNNKVTDTKKVSENTSVTNVIMPKVETYNPKNNLITDAEQYIYYTREVAEDERYTECNVLCKVKVTDGEEKIMIADNRFTISLIDFYNDNIYYSISDKNGFVASSNVFVTPANELNAVNNDDIVSYLDSEKNCIVKGSYIGIVVSLDDKLYLATKDSNISTIIYDGEATLLAATENDVFIYNSSNEIIRIDLTTKTAKTISSSEDDLYFEAKTNFEIAGNYIYCYNSYVGDEKTGYYINRFDLSSYSPTNELVGVVTSTHIKTA